MNGVHLPFIFKNVNGVQSYSVCHSIIQFNCWERKFCIRSYIGAWCKIRYTFTFCTSIWNSKDSRIQRECTPSQNLLLYPRSFISKTTVTSFFRDLLFIKIIVRFVSVQLGHESSSHCFSFVENTSANLSLLHS